MYNHLEKIILILNFTNMQKTHFMVDYWFLNNIYMMKEMLEEWTKSFDKSIYNKSDKQMVETYREISRLNACYKI